MRALLGAALCAALATAPAAAHAQSSQFGVRGLGNPGRPYSARVLGAAGSFSLFDGESVNNPAALASLDRLTTTFLGMQDFRKTESPVGGASLREARFPLVVVAGPLRRTPIALGLSLTSYTNRDFAIATADTLTIRGEQVVANDVFSSRGGLNDIRGAASIRLGTRTALGLGLHVISGSAREDLRRSFDDSTYRTLTSRAELSYAGVGLSLGVLQQVSKTLQFAASLRSDGHVNVDIDSTRVSTVDLPYTFSAGLQWRPSPKLLLGGHGVYRTWSGANSDFQAQGAPGSDNTFELSAGGEYVRDLRRPYSRPIRFGVHYATLPFLLTPGAQAHEFGVSAGTGMRFAADRGGIDLSLEHAWRSANDGYSERALIVSLGISVRP